ncbi:MAG: nitroreductase family protein [Deferribacterales bacterium]
MDFIELSRKRYSVRKFQERKVEEEKIAVLTEAGRVAPTASNLQPQRVIVIDSVEMLEKVKDSTPYHFNAPLVFLICYDTSVSWKRKFDGKDMGEVDASIVTTHIMLAAEDLGLGATWVAFFDPQVVKQKFSLPAGVEPVAFLPVGYPSEDSKPSQSHFSRLEADKTIFRNSF